MNTDTIAMKVVATILIFLASMSARAQLDPIFSVDPTYQSGLDSSRYRHRSSSPSAPSPAPNPPASDFQAPNEETVVDQIPAQPEPAVRVNAVTTSPPANPNSASTAAASPPMPESAPASSMGESPSPSAVAGQPLQSPNEIAKPSPASVRAAARPKVKRRPGIFEIAVAPVYFDNDSQSQYWYRNYNSNGPALDLAATAWVTSQLGLRFEYMSSFESSIPDNPFNEHSRTEVIDEWTNVGVRFRQRFGAHGNDPHGQAPTLTVGVDFSDYKLQVPSWETGRIGIETAGPRLVLGAEIPDTNHYSWTFGVHLTPRPSHREIATSVVVNSGPEVNADEIGASFGGRYRFSSRSRIFWQIAESVERDDFNGSSSPVDPNSDQSIAGVSVTNAFTFFKLGYIWGN